MRRRDLLLSLMAGTAGALLAPRRALVDGFDWHRDELPGQGRGRVIAMRLRDVALSGIPLTPVGPGDVIEVSVGWRCEAEARPDGSVVYTPMAAESGHSSAVRGPDVGVG